MEDAVGQLAGESGRPGPGRPGPSCAARYASNASRSRGQQRRRARRTPGRSAASPRRTAPPRPRDSGPSQASFADDRRVDQRRVDPQRQRRDRAPRSPRPTIPRWSAFSRRISARAAGRRAVDDPQVAPQRAVEPAPWIGPEVGVLVDAGRDRRVGELQQQRARPGAEQQHRLAIEPPRLGPGAEHPGGRRASRIHGAHR